MMTGHVTDSDRMNTCGTVVYYDDISRQTAPGQTK